MVGTRPRHSWLIWHLCRYSKLLQVTEILTLVLREENSFLLWLCRDWTALTLNLWILSLFFFYRRSVELWRSSKYSIHSLKMTTSPSPWPKWTASGLSFDPNPAGTYQLPEESNKPTRLNRTPSLAWWHPLLSMSITRGHMGLPTATAPKGTCTSSCFNSWPGYCSHLMGQHLADLRMWISLRWVDGVCHNV